jgi:hypothetical protein
MDNSHIADLIQRAVLDRDRRLQDQDKGRIGAPVSEDPIQPMKGTGE